MRSALEVSEILDKLACPMCYEVTSKCDPEKCSRECLSSCEQQSIVISDQKISIDLHSCVSCSSCIIACPLKAIDKISLQPDGGGLVCPQCLSNYRIDDKIVCLLPNSEHYGADSMLYRFYEEEYVKLNPTMHVEDADRKVNELLEVMACVRCFKEVMELGCGAGSVLTTFSKRLGINKVLGADLSKNILTFAKGKNPEPVYIQSDIAHLPFKNGSMELALVIDVLEHVPEPDQVLREITRVSEYLILRLPLDDYFSRFRRMFKSDSQSSVGHISYFTFSEMRSILTENHMRLLSYFTSYVREDCCKSRFSIQRVISLFRRTFRWLPIGVYRNLFSTNCVALCASRVTDRQSTM